MTQSHPEDIVVEGKGMKLWIHFNPDTLIQDGDNRRLFTCLKKPDADVCQVALMGVWKCVKYVKQPLPSQLD